MNPSRLIFTTSKTTIFLRVIFLFLTFSFLLNCSNSYIDDIDRSGGYQYKPGFPEVRLSTAGLVDEFTDSTRIQIIGEIVYASLVFKKAGSVFEANILIDIQILDQNDQTNIIETKAYPVTISEKSNLLVVSQEEYLFEEAYSLNPGDYLINYSVTDLNTGKQTIRTSEVFIPDPFDPVSNITNIQVSAKDESLKEGFDPVTTYDLSNRVDSIKFVFQVTNNRTEEPMTINTRLLKFKSDTTIARPMSYPNYNSSHISYRGIYFDKYDVVNSSRRIISQSGSVSIEFLFPNLPRGNYRFEVSSDLGGDNDLFKARDFSVKSMNYPTLRTPKELAAPLFYLMSKKEYEQLMSIEDDIALKKEIDRFWLRNIKNSKKAQNVISLFYERVEEANKQFASFKEGWKTDMGMIYILFGPPWYINSSLDNTIWSYSYNFNDFETNFYFKTPRLKSKFFPFDNYLLLRTQEYHSVEYRQIQLWLTGTIMRDNL
ncbi:MAG: GWxTD domain-containing protein [Balneolaceae bacterium]